MYFIRRKERNEVGFTYAFLVQYVTLFLLMGSFFVGAFFSPKLSPDPAKIHNPSSPPEESATTLLTTPFPLTARFSPETLSENQALHAYGTILLHHDIDLRCDLTDTVEAESDLMIRAAGLAQFFVDKGIPPSAVVVVMHQGEIPSTTCQLIRRETI